MSEETGLKVLALLDVLAIEVASGRADMRALDVKVTALDMKVTALDTKVERLDQRLGRVETRVEGLETDLRSFRHEFDRRITLLEQSS